MSRLLARIMLAIFMLPVAAIVYLAVFAVLYDDVYRRQEELCFVLSGLATGAFVAGYWVLLWRHAVPWSRTRVLVSVGAAVGALAAGGVTGWLMAGIDEDLGAFISGPVAVFSWLVATVLTWRETPAERASRFRDSGSHGLVCPACGYNLTGLTETTCPECGARYTLNELVAAQPGAERLGEAG